MTGQKLHVLFICIGNSARSIFAEAILRDLSPDRLNVFSAGTKPQSDLNPFALKKLEHNGHDVPYLRAKNIGEFQTEDAPAVDFVFTVCDQAANEECPAWQRSRGSTTRQVILRCTRICWNLIQCVDVGRPNLPMTTTA